MKEEFIYFPEPKIRKRPTGGKMKVRKLTVSYIYADQKTVPAIRISGAWLARIGFDLGQKAIIREQPGQLVIQLAEEADL
jgi:hypothetical protein